MAQVEELHLSNCFSPGWAAPAIRIGDRVYVAAAVVAHLVGERSPLTAIYGYEAGAVKYGPGARRVYVVLTEKLAEYMSPGSGEYARSDRERGAHAARVRSWESLVDLLPSAVGVAS